MLTVAALLSVLMPVLVWEQTWFGRELSERQLGDYLVGKRERRIQHALTQISHRISRGDSSVSRWYPQVAALAAHRTEAIRTTAAWVMGQDNRSELFHRALLGLLEDSAPMVRRNAALALVRFRDASGREELLEMLRPYTARAPSAGRVSVTVAARQSIASGALLVRITSPNGEAEVRSPFSGLVASLLVREGSQVQPGDRLVTLNPAREQVWEALRALYLIGDPDDLPELARYETATETDNLTRQQARLTVRAIRARSGPVPTH